MLASGRISGQRDHNGEIIGTAAWPAIITPQDTERIRAILSDPARRTNRTARRYALAGLLRCHACGAVLLAQPNNGTRRYACKTGADFTGCGKTYIAAEPVERLIAEAVLQRLDTPDLADALAGKAAADHNAAELSRQIAADQEQIEELARLYADRKITAAEWLTARDPIEARIKTARQTLARLTDTTALDGWVGNSQALRARWSSLNLDRQRAIIKAVLDHAVIGPGAPGRFDLNRVTAHWRL